MKIVHIPLKEILEDFFFSFASVRDTAQLKKSIETSGIRTPVHVRLQSGKYQLISGFSRYRAAKKLRMKEIPAVLVDKTQPVEKTFREILLEHLTSSTLNLVEKARILSILEAVYIDQDCVERIFLPLLELPQNPNLVDQLKNILSWPAKTQTYIETFDLSPKQTDAFRLLSDKERTLLADLGLKLQIRSVELSEIGKMLHEISKKDETDILTIYRNWDIEKIIKNEDWSRSQKVMKIKKHLYEKRYPRLYAWNSDLQRLKKSMKFSEKIRLQWDRSLEHPGIHLECQIQSIEDIRMILAELSKNENQKNIKQMLEMV
jgi:hypothetical protein